VEEIETTPPGARPAFLDAQAARFRARVASERREAEGVEPAFGQAESIFREFGIPFWLAVSQLEHGEWLAEQGRAREAEPLLAEARETFERLEATPWLERCDRLAPARAASASV
jgi:ATP/maltotriose-dependent transcriptional regulator MalT